MENQKISVIIPMYNEELVIEECYKRLKENITKLKKYDYELIFINDGSKDKTLEKIKEYKNNIFWSYSLKDYRKTNWWAKTANTSISQSITIRTANTMRKVLEICDKV